MVASVRAETVDCGTANGDGKSVRSIACDVSENKRSVKTLAWAGNLRSSEREKAIHARLNHPLIAKSEKYTPPTAKRQTSIVTDFVPNGSLADHLCHRV
jgi:serine/threonine protein kinase